jgi:hypothetical protein
MSAAQAPLIDAKTIISSNPEIRFTPLDDEMLAIDEHAGYCYSFNVSAAKIWDLIATPASVGSICAELCREFAVDPETCLLDVSDILNEMRAAGLVQVSHAPMD